MRLSKRAQQIMKKKASIAYPKAGYFEFANESVFNGWLAVVQKKKPGIIRKMAITKTPDGKWQAWVNFQGDRRTPEVVARDENGNTSIEWKINY